jgi:hypothetical protein
MNVTLDPIVRPHPQGGHTVAIPLPGTLTARIYVGQHSSFRGASVAARALSPRKKRVVPC